MDFKRILSDLQRAGLTQAEIAAACKYSQSGISDLARGATAQPRFGVGQALLALHAAHCKRPAKQAA